MSLNIDYESTLATAQQRVEKIKALEPLIEEFNTREMQLRSALRYFAQLGAELERVDPESKYMIGVQFVSDAMILRDRAAAFEGQIYTVNSNYGGNALMHRALTGWHRIKPKEDD